MCSIIDEDLWETRERVIVFQNEKTVGMHHRMTGVLL